MNHKHIYFTKNNTLPKVPLALLNTLEEIETFKNCFLNKDFAHTYASYEVPASLHLFLSNYFDYPICVRYQVIKNKLPVHTDINTNSKLNYLLQTGGPTVKTRWWNDVNNPTKIIQECKIKKFTWYNLTVNVPHDITEVISPRISITIKDTSGSFA